MPRTLVAIACLQTEVTDDFAGSSSDFVIGGRAGTAGLSEPAETAGSVLSSGVVLVDVAAPAGLEPADVAGGFGCLSSRFLHAGTTARAAATQTEVITLWKFIRVSAPRSSVPRAAQHE